MKRRVLCAGGPSVSSLGLGTSTWGFTTDRDEAAKQLKLFVDNGGNLLDTADIYGAGGAEEIIGQLLGAVVPREELVLTTKAAGVLEGRTPRPPDASKRHLLEALDNSLRRMGTDYVDLWQLHAWDPTVPLTETFEAVEVALASGRVRNAGVCNYTGEQTLAAATQCRIASVQVEYSLLERGVERDVVPVAMEHGLAVLPWAPLGRGVLTGKYRRGVPEDRGSGRFFQVYVGHYLDERSAAIVESVAEVADGLGTSPLAVSLAWIRDRPGVVAPLVGARTAEQLRESLAEDIINLELASDVITALDRASQS